MNLPFFGLRDLVLLVGALLGFLAAFLIPTRDGGRRNPIIPALGGAIILSGVIIFTTGLLSGFNLRVWGNTIGLIALGGTVLYEYRRSISRQAPVVARVKVVGESTPSVEMSPADAPPERVEAEHRKPMKVSCPACGTVIEILEGTTWIKCPKCGLEGKIG